MKILRNKIFIIILLLVISIFTFITISIYNILSDNNDYKEIIHPSTAKKYYIIRSSFGLDPAFYYVSSSKPNISLFLNEYTIDTNNSIKIYEDFCYSFNDKDMIIYTRHHEQKTTNHIIINDVNMYDCDTTYGYYTVFELFAK